MIFFICRLPLSAEQDLGKVVHLQHIYLCLSRFGCSFGELQIVWPDKFFQAKQLEDKNLASIFRQDMELLMTESHMYLLDIKSRNNLEAQKPGRDTSIPSVSAGLDIGRQ